MNLNEAVDFETFYFHNLLETILKKSENIFDESLQQSLKNFMDFLSSEKDPLDSIEKLAQLQGTSDLSIFFSDLIERLSEVPPEDAMQNNDSYANDFLEIYRELAKDQQWQSTIYQELIGTDVPEELKIETKEDFSEEVVVPDTENEIDFKTFIHTELKERILTRLGSMNSPAVSEIEPFFDLLTTINLENNPFDKYQNVASVMPLINSLNELMQYLPDRNKLENYIEEFDTHIDQLCETMDDLYKNNFSDFQAFISNDLPAVEQEIPTEQLVAEELSDMEVIENLPDVSGSEKKELTDEDINLRWLLRDYITHEIEELTKEISTQFQHLKASPSNEEAQSIILDNIKVLKDLGQIHKYSHIETGSLGIGKVLKSAFASGSVIPSPAVDLIERIFSDFNQYVDAALQNKEQNLVASINNSVQELTGMFGPPPAVEMEVSLKDTAEIEPGFTEVNSRFLRRLEHNFDAILKNPDDDNLKGLMIHDISHLRYWYNLLGLTGAENLLEVFANWLQNKEKREKLINKFAEVGITLRALSEKLFNTTFDEWTGYLEKLTMAAKEPIPVDVNKSLKAFVEVTHRQLAKLEKSLQDENASVSEYISNHFIPVFKQIEENSLLIDNQSLNDFCKDSLEIFESLSAEGPDKFEFIRKELSKPIQELSEAVTKMPLPLPLPRIKDQLDSLLKNLREIGLEEKTSLPTQMEEFEEKPDKVEEIDESEELNAAFDDEARKFLEVLDHSIATLNNDLKNKEELSKIEDTLHSLSSSARMLGKPDIADITGALESLTEMVQNDKVKILKQYVSLCRRVSKGVDKILANKKVDPKKIVNSINNYIKKNTLESDSPESAKKKSGISKSKTAPAETEQPPKPEELDESEKSAEKPIAAEPPQEPLLKLTEEDPELIEIFKNEAKDNLDSISTNLNLIEKFRYDKQTLQVLDHAIHEIRSAAKMLGFDEVAYLVDQLEEIVELISKKDPENWRNIIPVFRRSIQVIGELTNKQKVSQTEYNEVADSLSNTVLQLRGTEDAIETVQTPHEKPDSSEDFKSSQMMIQSFIQESREYLEDMNFVLMKMEKEPGNSELTEQLMRTIHTLKGSSSMVGQEEMEELIHAFEDYIQTRVEDKKEFASDDFELFFQVVDELEFIINALASSNKVKLKNYDNLLSKLRTKGESISKGDIPEPATPAGITDKKQEKEVFTLTDEIQKEKIISDESQLKIDTKKIDNLLNEAAELVINNNQLKTQIDRYKVYLPKLDLEGKNLQNILWQLEKIQKEQERHFSMLQPGLENLSELENVQKGYLQEIQTIIENLGKVQNNFTQAFQGLKDSGKVYEEQLFKISSLSNQIHEEIMHARLIPIGMLFRRFHRPLRDMATSSGKKIKLFVEGESTEIDRLIAEALFEPILHIIRNAIDHGIEPVKTRKKSGKNEEGLIQINAVRERNNVIITIEDDGEGVNVDKIKDKLLEKEILKSDDIDKLTTHELYEYLSYPGFSTLKEAGKISGRGVGLDVVRNQIQKLKGDLRITSLPGKMTRMTIRVPISITVTQAMLVNIDDNNYAIPLLQVEETINISPDKLTVKNKEFFIQFRGGEIPIIHMSDLLQIHGKGKSTVAKNTIYPIIVVQDEGKKVGLLVDKIIQREEILIKNIGEILQRTKYIMGGSIMEDGSVVLVLDIPQIVFTNIRLTEKDMVVKPSKSPEPLVSPSPGRHGEIQKTISPKKIKGRKPLILIVDDSLSVRKFLSGVLGKHSLRQRQICLHY